MIIVVINNPEALAHEAIMGSRQAVLEVLNRAPLAAVPAFVACPTMLVAPAVRDRIEAIYQAAYESAREINRPSRWAPLYTASVN